MLKLGREKVEKFLAGFDWDYDSDKGILFARVSGTRAVLFLDFINGVRTPKVFSCRSVKGTSSSYKLLTPEQRKAVWVHRERVKLRYRQRARLKKQEDAKGN